MTEHVLPEAVSNKELTPDQWASVHEADTMFDMMCKQRYEDGVPKYGEYTFLDAPTLSMALEEIVDLANYARFSFIKIYLLMQNIGKAQARDLANANPGGFVPTSELFGGKL